MNSADFGKLIASLRKEHEDEFGVTWSQETLAHQANLAAGVDMFTQYVISKIEQGRRRLDEQTAVALATALQLTSGERKEFFLAASGIDNERIARPENDPDEVVSQLVHRLKQTYLPAFIIDQYYDSVAANYAVMELLNWLPEMLEGDPSEGQPFPLNALQFVFSSEAVKYLGECLGENWAEHAFQTVMLFRTVSLRYRSTDYFQDLLQELMKNRGFRRYWRQVYFDEKDQFVDNRHVRFNSPKWGPLVSYCSYVTAVTTAGELHMCIYVPTTQETAKAFLKIAEGTSGPRAYRLDRWPQKDPSTKSRLRPVS